MLHRKRAIHFFGYVIKNENSFVSFMLGGEEVLHSLKEQFPSLFVQLGFVHVLMKVAFVDHDAEDGYVVVGKLVEIQVRDGENGLVAQ